MASTITTMEIFENLKNIELSSKSRIGETTADIFQTDLQPLLSQPVILHNQPLEPQTIGTDNKPHEQNGLEPHETEVSHNYVNLERQEAAGEEDREKVESVGCIEDQDVAEEIQHEAGEDQHVAGEVQHETGKVQTEAGEAQHEAGEVQHEAREDQHEAGEVQHEAGEVQHEALEVVTRFAADLATQILEEEKEQPETTADHRFISSLVGHTVQTVPTTLAPEPFVVLSNEDKDNTTADEETEEMVVLEDVVVVEKVAVEEEEVNDETSNAPVLDCGKMPVGYFWKREGGTLVLQRLEFDWLLLLWNDFRRDHRWEEVGSEDGEG